MRNSETVANKTVVSNAEKNYTTQNSKDVKKVEGSRSGMGHSGTMNSNILMSLSRSPTSRSGKSPSQKQVANFKNDKDNI